MQLRFFPLLLLAAMPLVVSAAEPSLPNKPSVLPYVDEFDSPHDWVTESATWITKIKDGRFLCENLTPTVGYLKWMSKELPLEKGRDFEILTRVKMVEGSPAGNAAILWDAGDGIRRVFEISASGKYGIYGATKDVWYYDHTDVPSKLIQPKEDNDLAIRGIGGRVYFFINGAAVDAIDYAGPAAPWVGLVTPAGCTNSFDRFEVRYLDGTPEKRAADANKYEVDVQASLIASGVPLQDFVETFDDNSHGWDDIKDGNGWSSKIANGVLEWANKKPDDNKQRSYVKVPVNTAADYELSFRARHVAGNENVFVGLSWSWGADYKSTHEFGFAPQGYYLFGSSKNGIYDNAVPWTETTLIKKNEFNELKVRKLDRTLFLFVNGQVVADTPAKPLQGEQLSTVVSQGTTVAFDDIRVTYPKLTDQQTAAEKEKLVAALKAGHGKPGVGIVYSVAKQHDLISAQAKVDMQRLEDQRWKLTDADDKQMAKVRKQFDGKKMISLFGSWGHPVKTSQDGGSIYYNYKLVGRTQYYYWFQLLKRGKQEEWLIQNISFSDNPI